MNRLALRVFQREVQRQCRFAIIANEEMENALRLSEASEITESMVHDEYFWYSLQAFLIAVGNISKLLWPSPPRRGKQRIIPNRGEWLRESLDVPEDSCLHSRRLRNHFEHFDERLEEWADPKKLAHSMIDSNLVYSDLFGEDLFGEGKPNNVFRNYDPERKIAIFQKERYELRPILHEVEKLWQRASAEMKKPY
jgi:hypothetical protein